MAYNIKDVETDRLIRRLAQLKRTSILDAIREACANEIAREQARIPLWTRLQPLIAEIAARPKTGLKADKQYFDALWGDEG